MDAVSWHTYDYRSSELGGEDHRPIPYPPPADFVNKFFDPVYHDVVDRLAENMSAIVQNNAPHLADKIWLTESNSICHQGVFNVTNAFANSIWLVDRFGIMANRGTQLMARQSLIGYNYSLLGNFPVEPIRAAPDYFTTILWRKLVGHTVLQVAAHDDVGTADANSGLLRSYAYCSAEHPGGGVTLALVNLDTANAATTSVSFTGAWEEYVGRKSPLATKNLLEVTDGLRRPPF